MAALAPLQQQIKIPPQISNVTLNPSSVTGGAQVAGIVTLTQPAPSGGVAVTFQSSNSKLAAVPQGVVVQPGATSATFIAQTYPVVVNPNVIADPPTVQISAQIGNQAPKIVNLIVRPPTLTALTLNPTTVGGGSNSTGTVTISGPAPAGGLAIALYSQAATSAAASQQRPTTDIARQSLSATIPSQVTIAANATSASFTIATRGVSTPTSVNITAAWGVFVTKTATLTVAPPELASLSLAPGSLFAGNPSTATVNLTAPAPAEGMIINLKTGRASGGTTGTFAQCGEFPSVPPTVTVPSGTASATFTVTTYPGYGVYWVEASSITNSSRVSKPLWADSPFFKPILPSSVKGGTPVQGAIQLTGPAMPANCGNRYSVVSSNTSLAQVPPYVDLTPGATQAPLPITTSALPSNSAPQTVTISVTGTVVNNGVATPGQQTYNANLTITP
jgi:hypothetical protein